MDKQLIIDILKQEVVPALGCTEPASVAYCAATAYHSIKGEIQNVNLIVSPNIYKNGMGVGIPGVDRVGLHVAAVLGAVAGNADLKLEALNDVKEDDKEKCYEIIDSKKVKVDVDNNKGTFYIECIVKTENGEGKCIIKNRHTNIMLIKSNNNVLYENKEEEKSNAALSEKLKDYAFMDFINEVENMTFKELQFMLDGAVMNMEMARVGLNSEIGMKTGRTIKEYIESGILSDDIYHNVVMMTAAASDARMSGYFMPVMSSAGSGNHGLTAIIPVVVVSKKMACGDEKLVKALAISHLTTIYIKQYIGRLSGICGCGVAASTGAAVGICYLLGGGEKEFHYTIKNMIGDVTGIICDGAKKGCAIKLSTAAGVAIKSALLAIKGAYVPSDNGVVGYTIEDTIRNLGKIGSDAMVETDKMVLRIMVDKNKAMLNC